MSKAFATPMPHALREADGGVVEGAVREGATFQPVSKRDNQSTT
jgi:hypothetical protein